MAANAERWPDQCTYWHFLKVLQKLKDPKVLMVQARIGQNNGKEAGELLPIPARRRVDRFKVIVTDGTRSNEDVVSFSSS